MWYHRLSRRQAAYYAGPLQKPGARHSSSGPCRLRRSRSVRPYDAELLFCVAELLFGAAELVYGAILLDVRGTPSSWQGCIVKRDIHSARSLIK